MIVFGRDFDTKVVCWKGEGAGGWGRFLQTYADELEAGEFWTLEELGAGSEDEEDMIGYESYFSGGGAGAGQGGGDRGGEGAAVLGSLASIRGGPCWRRGRIGRCVCGNRSGWHLESRWEILNSTSAAIVVDARSHRLSMLENEADLQPPCSPWTRTARRSTRREW